MALTAVFVSFCVSEYGAGGGGCGEGGVANSTVVGLLTVLCWGC